MGKSVECKPLLELQSSEESKQENPPWFAEVLVLLSRLVNDQTLSLLREKVHIERGRAGTFHSIDFLMLLFTYAASHAPHIKEFFRQVRPVRDVLPALWNREKMPSQSALSRFLSDVTSKPTEALRTLFLPTYLHTKTSTLGASLIAKTNTESFSMRMVRDRLCGSEA
jgi:hypothetical protein